MQNATQTADPRRSLSIETDADARATVAYVNELMDGLEAVVEEETALVRGGQLRQATALGPKKAELSGFYFRAAEQLKSKGNLLARTLPQDVGALARRHDLLQAVLKTNLAVLATAHAAWEGIIRRLSGDLARKACPQVYGASGRTIDPDPKRGQPLALSRML
jgi:hypothetical protein